MFFFNPDWPVALSRADRTVKEPAEPSTVHWPAGTTVTVGNPFADLVECEQFVQPGRRGVVDLGQADTQIEEAEGSDFFREQPGHGQTG